MEQHEAAVEQNEQNSQTQAAASAAAHEANKATAEQEAAAKDNSAPVEPASPKSSRDDANAGTTPTKTAPPMARPGGLAMPLVPAIPKPASKPASAAKPQTDDKQATTEVSEPATQATESTESDAVPDEAESVSSPPVKAPPTSWANLFTKASSGAPAGSVGPNGQAVGANINGGGSTDGTGVAGMSGSSFAKANANSLAEAIRAYRVGGEDKLSFLEPRGLINTGNMCYMNSVRCSARQMKAWT